jgi:hypothetical protein
MAWELGSVATSLLEVSLDTRVSISILAFSNARFPALLPPLAVQLPLLRFDRFLPAVEHPGFLTDPQ